MMITRFLRRRRRRRRRRWRLRRTRRFPSINRHIPYNLPGSCIRPATRLFGFLYISLVFGSVFNWRNYERCAEMAVWLMRLIFLRYPDWLARIWLQSSNCWTDFAICDADWLRLLVDISIFSEEERRRRKPSIVQISPRWKAGDLEKGEWQERSRRTCRGQGETACLMPVSTRGYHQKNL